MKLVDGVKQYFLWPTERGWNMLAAAGAALLVVMVNPIPTATSFCAALFALVFASLALGLFSLWTLRLEVLPSPDGCFGEHMLLPVRVTNVGWLPHGPFAVMETLPFHVIPDCCVRIPGLRGKTSLIVKRDVINVRRGVYELREIRLYATDPAGLFCREKVVPAPRQITITPGRVHLDWLPLRLRSRQVADSTTDSLGVAGNGQEFFGVREYRRTDCLRSIHWKATARRKRLMVREFEENAVSQVSIFLDTHAAHVTPGVVFNNLEYQILAAASVVDYLSKLYCRVLVRWPELDTQAHPLYGFAHNEYADIMAGLTQLQPGPASDPAALLNANLDLIPPLSILYCFTLHAPPELAETFAYLAGRGVDVRWLQAPAALFSHNAPTAAAEAPATDRLQPLLLAPDLNLAQVLAYG